MKAIEACLPCEILISKYTPHGKKKKKEMSRASLNPLALLLQKAIKMEKEKTREGKFLFAKYRERKSTN